MASEQRRWGRNFYFPSPTETRPCCARMFRRLLTNGTTSSPTQTLQSDIAGANRACPQQPLQKQASAKHNDDVFPSFSLRNVNTFDTLTTANIFLYPLLRALHCVFCGTTTWAEAPCFNVCQLSSVLYNRLPTTSRYNSCNSLGGLILKLRQGKPW